MKKPLKTSACAIAAVFALFACEDIVLNNNISPNSKNKGSLPVMSDKVVSYQIAHWNEALGFEGIITDTETLKLWFPNDYDEQKEDCNYFAIYNSTNSTSSGYLVLTKGMTLYSLHSSSGEGCVETCDIFYEAMLVCDDKAGTIQNKFKRESYAVPDWDCTKWETEPKKGFFPIHPIPPQPKPIMDSRVVSYQNVQHEAYKIITNSDTLKLFFPHIFNNGQAKAQCNYFAMTFDHRNFYYEPFILSEDTLNSGYVLFDVRPGGAYGENCKSVIKNEGLSGAFLICDDEAYTLKNIIKPYNTPYYYLSPGLWLDPDWDCESGIGAPEEIFF